MQLSESRGVKARRSAPWQQNRGRADYCQMALDSTSAPTGNLHLRSETTVVSDLGGDSLERR